MQKGINFNEKIFVAGSNGMVGSAICRELIKSGYGLKENNGLLLTPTRKELNLLDYRDVNTWFTLNKPSVVILAAAKVGGIYANNQKPSEFILENLKIQNNVTELAWRHGVKKFLFLGSSCIYPKFSQQPIKEEYLLTDSLEKTNEFYAIAKIAGIKLCESLRKQHNFDSISLMPTNLYGPGDNYHLENSHVLPALIRKFSEAKEFNKTEVICWGTGKPLREFLYVDDLAEACVFVLENFTSDTTYNSKNNKDNSSLINLGSKYEISIKDLAQKVALKCGYEGKIIWDKSKPDGTPRKKLDISKLSSLGWDAKTNLDVGISKTIEAFNNEKKSGKLRLV